MEEKIKIDFNKLLELFQSQTQRVAEAKLAFDAATRDLENTKSKLFEFVNAPNSDHKPHKNIHLEIELFKDSVNLNQLVDKIGEESVRNRAIYLVRNAPYYFIAPLRNVDLGKAIWLSKYGSFGGFDIKNKNSLSGQIGGFITDGSITKFVNSQNANDVRLFPSDWKTSAYVKEFEEWINLYNLIKYEQKSP